LASDTIPLRICGPTKGRRAVTIRIAAVSDRPELAPLMAARCVAAFAQHAGGYAVEEMTALILAPPDGSTKTFLLFDGEDAAGTAGLVRSDLDTRPDLTRSLAGVVVPPLPRAQPRDEAGAPGEARCRQRGRAGDAACHRVGRGPLPTPRLAADWFRRTKPARTSC